MGPGRRKNRKVENLLVLVKGTAPVDDGVIMLSAHSDSVKRGSGAADDGAGFASIISIAKILKYAPPKNNVLLLITDGEESGSIGAQAFTKHQSLYQ